MADACFPAVRSLTSIESEAFIWVDVDFGGHADPQSALEAVRWYCREKGYKHFLRVRFRPSPPSYKDNGIYTYAFRDASTARLWRDVVKDPNLDPPGLTIDRNGTPEPFTVPRNKRRQPSLKTLHAVLQDEDNGGPWIISNKSLEKISEEKIKRLIQKRRDKTHAGTGDVTGSGGGGGGGDGALSSQTAITSSPTNQPAAAASAGSPPAASASSEAGMTPQDTTPRPSPCTTPGTTQRQRLKQPSQSDSQFARSGSGERSFLALPSQAHDSSVQAFGGGGAGGGGAGGLTSGSDSSREPEGDRTDGSSAKKAKTTHHRATSACAGQAEERVAGMGSSLQSQASTLTYVDQPEPGEPELFPLAVHDLDMQTSPPFDDWDRARALALPLLCGDDWYGVAPELAAKAAIKAITTFLRDHLEDKRLRVLVVEKAGSRALGAFQKLNTINDRRLVVASSARPSALVELAQKGLPCSCIALEADTLVHQGRRPRKCRSSTVYEESGPEGSAQALEILTKAQHASPAELGNAYLVRVSGSTLSERSGCCSFVHVVVPNRCHGGRHEGDGNYVPDDASTETALGRCYSSLFDLFLPEEAL